MATDNEQDLRDWLEGKPRERAQIVAVRAALRALPFVGHAATSWLGDFADRAIRAVAISWAAHNIPAHDMTAAADDAAACAATAARATATAYTDAAAAYATAAAYADAAYADAAAAAAYAPDATDARLALWAAVFDDCDWLDRNAGGGDAARVLSRRSLWLGQRPDWWRAEQSHFEQALRGLDQGYGVWIDWFERRVRGERAAFDIPGDRYRKEDKAILIRLAEASNEDFWDKGAAHVNAALQGWIDEARERVAPRAAPAEDEAAALPAQARHAVRFRAGADGRIAIDAAALADTLRTDAEARDRHAEAVALARAVLAGLGSNTGARMIPMLKAYLEAASDGVETMRPSLFVQRGERLRQELAGYERPDTELPPLADPVLRDGRSWRSAHNMTVGLDPVLNALDTAQLGPDARPAPLAPEEIRELARAADAAGVLEDGVADVVIEAADLAPAVPDPADRRTIWSSETAKNLVIEAFAVALKYPRTTLAGIATTAVVAPHISAAAVVVGVPTAASFLVAHREWIESRLGDTPTWQSLFVRLCDRLEALTPFRPRRRDGDDGA
ncbi:MAG TPA: hypothetical protein PKD99_16170 [Sphingopyxis sp.]|nr:hypothetical protein [Sphingopyxis sp.]HMP46637.1 hypothetical protein [Sphingopyxis sp.]